MKSLEIMTMEERYPMIEKRSGDSGTSDRHSMFHQKDNRHCGEQRPIEVVKSRFMET